jgi:hypothetical protein
MRGWICRLQLLLAFASAVILGAESRGNYDHILLSQIRGSPNLEDQVVFMSSSYSAAQLYFQASYNSQGNDGGIWTTQEPVAYFPFGTYGISDTKRTA